ncbi:unnamed protein product [Ceutorhynchus assimilis]|uniref:Uncharacterized protein n=1 Tax=Ceutorhynchus assimilis TaxID=467358 RepID=A0A9P0GS16_9CUCU|nr:unnamed protein product [Ceutorhynchus assimilis]
MPKTSRQPFTDHTNTLNMNSAKTDKRNTSKIATRTRSVVKKSKAAKSDSHLLRDADENVIKTTLISSPNKQTKSDNLPTGKTGLSHKISKDNAANKSPRTTKKPIEKSESKTTPDKPKTNKNNSKYSYCYIKLKPGDRICDQISKNKTLVKKIKTTQKSTKPITTNNRPEVVKGISKIKITEKPLQNEDSQKIVSKQLKVVLVRYMPDKQKVTFHPNLQKDKKQFDLKNQPTVDPQHCSPEKSVPSKTNVPCEQTKSDFIPTQVTTNSNLQKNKKRYGLRQGGKENLKYKEEFVLDSDSGKSEEHEPVYKKAHSVPIYKHPIPKLPQNQPQTEDPYDFTPEFTDVKLNKKRPQKDISIIYDKDTHEIVQKLEKKEAKLKKRIQRKKKPYDKIIGDIVSNVMQKITKKTLKNPLITKMDKTNIDVAVEFIKSHVPTTTELPSTSTANSVQNVAIRKPQPKFTVLSNKLLKKGVTEPEIDGISSEDLPSTSAKSLQDVAVRTLVPESTSLNNKLPTTSTTVPESAQKSIVNQDSKTINTDQRRLFKQVPKTSIAFLRQDLPTTSTPNRTSNLCNKSLNEADRNSCFGFDDDDGYLSPLANSSDETLGSPVEFHKKPNANSTMVGVQYNSRPSRAEGPRISYFNCKHNGLPSGSQQIFIDHTIAEAFEHTHTPSKTPLREEFPAKRPAVQQSILDYVDHNDHLTYQNKTLEASLYNIEELQSPKKKKETPHIENVNLAKRIIQFPTGSSIKRKPLGDISNSSDEITFYRSDSSPRKASKNVSDENAKPFRFDPNLLKVYSKKKRNNQIQKEPEVKDKARDEDTEEATAEETSISIMENSRENSDENVADVGLFEDPEKVLDDMALNEISLMEFKRKRHGTQKRKAKKTKLDAEAETWIQQFNDKCQAIEQHQLEIE